MGRRRQARRDYSPPGATRACEYSIEASERDRGEHAPVSRGGVVSSRNGHTRDAPADPA